MKRVLVLLATFTALPLLAGCAFQDYAAGRACPQVALLADATEISQFGTLGALNPDAMIYHGALGNPQADCTYRRDGVDVEIQFDISALRSSLMTADTLKLNYFLSILDQNDNILTRKSFPVTLDFPTGTEHFAGQETLKTFIPLIPGEDGGDYQIIGGFQLSRDQLDFNQRKRLGR